MTDNGGFEVLIKGSVLTIITITSWMNPVLTEAAYAMYYKSSILLSFNPNSTWVDLGIEMVMKSLPFITLLLYILRDHKKIGEGIDWFLGRKKVNKK